MARSKEAGATRTTDPTNQAEADSHSSHMAQARATAYESYVGDLGWQQPRDPQHAQQRKVQRPIISEQQATTGASQGSAAAGMVERKDITMVAASGYKQQPFNTSSRANALARYGAEERSPPPPPDVPQARHGAAIHI